MKIAVIETGGTQYLVKTGDRIKISALKGEQGSRVSFEKVLLYLDGETVKIGRPYVEGEKVEGRIIKQGRDKKVLVMKYKSKTRYRRKKGHRQNITNVEITKV